MPHNIKKQNTKGLIKYLLRNIVEQALQDIGIGHYINSKETAEHLLAELLRLSKKAIRLHINQIHDEFQCLGYQLVKDFHTPLYTLLRFIEYIRSHLQHAISHDLIPLKHEDLNIRLDYVINGLSHGYLIRTVEESLSYNYDRNDPINYEMDIKIHERWYRELLLSINNNQNLPELLYENSESFQWVNSLDFKLLVNATSFNHESYIIILHQNIFELGREVVNYVKNKDYQNAYHYLMQLEQKVQMLSNILKEVFIKYMLNKLSYFFNLFSNTIKFEQQYSYFLTVSISSSFFRTYSTDINHFFLNLLTEAKKEAMKSQYDICGVVDNGNSMHILMHYSQESNIDDFLVFLKSKVAETNKTSQLFLPEFILRSAKTAIFSGMNADKLHLLAIQMSKYSSSLPQYHFSSMECETLRDTVENCNRINEIVFKKLEKGDVELYFQPIVKIENKQAQLVYCEVLSRLYLEGDVIEAEQFIHSVTSNKLGNRLDKIVFTKLIQLVDSIRDIMSGISVNLFPESFKDSGTMKIVEDCLTLFQEQGLQLTLEITEYDLFENYELLEDLYSKYSNTLNISMDDFGTGYSSLASLNKLSQNGLLQSLKIDGSLIKGILEDESSYQIVKMAIGLAHTLNARVIVEYIENSDLLEKVYTITESFYAQGYYFGKAQPLSEIEHSSFPVFLQ